VSKQPYRYARKTPRPARPVQRAGQVKADLRRRREESIAAALLPAITGPTSAERIAAAMYPPLYAIVAEEGQRTTSRFTSTYVFVPEWTEAYLRAACDAIASRLLIAAMEIRTDPHTDNSALALLADRFASDLVTRFTAWAMLEAARQDSIPVAA
jgi:hypothetical protein